MKRKNFLLACCGLAFGAFGFLNAAQADEGEAPPTPLPKVWQYDLAWFSELKATTEQCTEYEYSEGVGCAWVMWDDATCQYYVYVDMGQPSRNLLFPMPDLSGGDAYS